MRNWGVGGLEKQVLCEPVKMLNLYKIVDPWGRYIKYTDVKVLISKTDKNVKFQHCKFKVAAIVKNIGGYKTFAQITIACI